MSRRASRFLLLTILCLSGLPQLSFVSLAGSVSPAVASTVQQVNHTAITNTDSPITLDRGASTVPRVKHAASLARHSAAPAIHPSRSALSSAVSPAHHLSRSSVRPFGLSARIQPNSATLLSGSLNGTVTMSGGAGLGGTTVTILPVGQCEYQEDSCTYANPSNLTATTDSSGAFSFSGLFPGLYTLRYDVVLGQSGYTYYSGGQLSQLSATPVIVSANATTNASLVLTQTGTIVGTLTDARTGQPLAGASASVSVASGNVPAPSPGTYTTDANGVYTATLLPGAYNVSFSDNLHLSASYASPVTVTSGTTVSSINGALQPYGVITGTVTDASTGLPVQNTLVYACQSGYYYYCFYDSMYTDNNGLYSFDNLSPGSNYTIWVPAPTTSFVGDASIVYPNLPSTNVSLGTAFAISAGSIYTNVNVALPVGGVISGTVTDAATGQPISGACVGLNNSVLGTCAAPNADTDSNGHYQISGLVSGTYTLAVNRPSGSAYRPVVYPNLIDGAPGSGTPLTITTGVTNSTVITDVNVALPVGGSIAGTVSDANGPVVGATVSAYLAGSCANVSTYYYSSCYYQSSSVPNVQTASDGSYALTGLAAGTYELAITPPSSSTDLPLIYTQAGGQVGTVLGNGDLITITQGTARGTQASSYNASLIIGGQISGVVRDASGPLAGAVAYAYPTSCTTTSSCSATASSQATSSTGSYAISGLPLGSYYVYISPPSGVNDLGLVYSQAGGQTGTTLTGGDSITITQGTTEASQVTSINATLPAGGTISGTVVDQSTGQPVSSAYYVDVYLYASCATPPCTYSSYQTYTSPDASGHFSFTGLPAGAHYRVTVEPQSPYIAQVYNGHAGYAVTAGDDISVSAGVITTLTTIQLSQTSPSPTGTLQGRITDSTGTPLSNVSVSAIDPLNEGNGRSTTTDSNGSYTISGLVSSTYQVEFAPNTSGYPYYLAGPNATQWNLNHPDQALADDVAISPNTVTTLNQTLPLVGGIYGTITSSGNPAAGVTIEVQDSAGNILASTTSGSTGSYAFLGLPYNGSYYLYAHYQSGNSSFIPRYYSTLGNYLATNISNATPVSLVAGDSISQTFPLLSGPMVTVDTTSVEPCGTFNLTGANFVPGETITITIPEQNPVILTASISGSFTVALSPAAGTPAGTLTVSVVAQNEGLDQLSETVTGSGGGQSVTVTPHGGPAGSIVAVSGTHYLPNEPISLTLVTASSAGSVVQEGSLLTTTADSSGNFAVASYLITATAGLPVNRYFVRATGGCGLEYNAPSSSSRFVVLPASTPLRSASVSPTGGGIVTATTSLNLPVSISLPPGAVTVPVTVTVAEATTAPPPDIVSNTVGLGTALEFDATDAIGAAVSTFNTPIIITLHYDPSALPALGMTPQDIQITFYDPTSDTWTALPTTVDTTADTATATTTHFTLYQLRGTPNLATATPTATPTSVIVGVLPTSAPAQSTVSVATSAPATATLAAAPPTTTAPPTAAALSSPVAITSTAAAIPTSQPPAQTATELPTPVVVFATPLPTPQPSPTLIPVTDQQIDPSGGIISARFAQQNNQGHQSNQDFTLIIPKGSVSTTVEIHVSVALPASIPTTTLTANNAPIGAAVDLTATTSSGQPVHTFNPPLILQFSYDPATLGGLDPKSLTIAFYNPFTQVWVSLPTTVDTTAHLLTATVGHFTLFEVRATARTAAQLRGALARIGSTTVSAQVVSAPNQTHGKGGLPPAPGGIPALITIPSGTVLAGTAATIHVLGAPRATVIVTFTMAQKRVVSRTVLDSHGYAAIAAPALPPRTITMPQTTCKTVTTKVKGKTVKKQECTPVQPHTVCKVVTVLKNGKKVTSKVCQTVGAPVVKTMPALPQKVRADVSVGLESIILRIAGTFTLISPPQSSSGHK